MSDIGLANSQSLIDNFILDVIQSPSKKAKLIIDIGDTGTRGNRGTKGALQEIASETYRLNLEYEPIIGLDDSVLFIELFQASGDGNRNMYDLFETYIYLVKSIQQKISRTHIRLFYLPDRSSNPATNVRNVEVNLTNDFFDALKQNDTKVYFPHSSGVPSGRPDFKTTIFTALVSSSAGAIDIPLTVMKPGEYEGEKRGEFREMLKKEIIKGV